jgi:hypothetical protein
MNSTTSNRGLVEYTEAPPDEVEYICIAAYLLQQMFSKLRTLAGNNTDLARAMSSRGSDARDRLCALHETVDLLMGVDDDSTAVPLRRRATALISWLSDEIDELTLFATGDERVVNTFRVASH